MIDARPAVTGLILAGGQSRRMGGGDKGLLDLAGKPMIAHVIERLRRQVGRIVINANGDPARFSRFCFPVVADSIGGFAGPLAGVLAGLRWSSANAPDASHVASVSADAPFLPENLVEQLWQALEGCTDRSFSPPRLPHERKIDWARGKPGIAIAASGGELHPVIGLWPVALADDLEAALASGLRKVLDWTDRHGTLPVEFPFLTLKGRQIDPFFNANTPEELDEARALLQT